MLDSGSLEARGVAQLGRRRRRQHLGGLERVGPEVDVGVGAVVLEARDGQVTTEVPGVEPGDRQAVAKPGERGVVHVRGLKNQHRIASTKSVSNKHAHQEEHSAPRGVA